MVGDAKKKLALAAIAAPIVIFVLIILILFGATVSSINQCSSGSSPGPSSAGVSAVPAAAPGSGTHFSPQAYAFAVELQKQTGLDGRVVEAWMMAEEPVGGASNPGLHNQNWLNIAYYDSGAGPLASAQVFATPQGGADATARFLQGSFGGASPGIRGILDTAGQSQDAQIAAIAGSGWASSGYAGGSTIKNNLGNVPAITNAAPGSASVPVSAQAGSSLGSSSGSSSSSCCPNSGSSASGGASQLASTGPGGGAQVHATMFGPPGVDASVTNTQGAGGDLDHGDYIAELGTPQSAVSFSNAHRLADLIQQGTQAPQSVGGDAGTATAYPFGTTFQVTAPGGKSIVVTKKDIGAGAPGAEMDLWYVSAEDLGLPGAQSGTWSGTLSVKLLKLGTGQAGAAPSAGTAVSNLLSPGSQGCSQDASLSGGAAGAAAIVKIAQSQIGTGENPPGSNCQPYGPCESWCSLFVTWVWMKAGEGNPSIPYSGDVGTWAAAHGGKVLPPTATPAPGDAVAYGSSSTSSDHIGIVEKVFPDGSITTIEGNFGNVVSHNGPFKPADAAAAGEPAPIYQFVQPPK